MDVQSVLEIEPQDVFGFIGQPSVNLIDVRSLEEFHGELGHVPSSQLVTLGEDLAQYLNLMDKAKKTIFICRSGARSGRATALAMQMGFNQVYNMKGGMILWNELGLKVER